jgi:2-phospho-L-lactate/phosphoenolpyruvate guanylyltransferase
MSMWAIVPVKPLAESKSRLAAVLDSRARERLVVMMLEHELRVLRDCTPPLEGTLVVSEDERALEIARGSGAIPWVEHPRTGLNDALSSGVREAVRRGADTIVILPCDLPMLTGRDILDLLGRIPKTPGVALVPDLHRRGTNALAASPPHLLDFEFGESSFPSHCAQARAKHATLAIVERPGLMLDIDSPEDLGEIGDLVARARVG